MTPPVTIEGVYTVWDPMPRRGADLPPARQVRIVGADGDGPFLGAFGHDGHLRDPAEIARLAGRRVRVTGVYHAEMPPHPTDPPEAAALAGPCVHPVTGIETVEGL